jgi:hypothetical protein
MNHSTDQHPPSGGRGAFTINKGINKPVEFMGLKSQYLFIFTGGLLGIVILFMVMYMTGVAQSVCIGFALITAPLLTWQTFSLNKKYGTHGLMKLQAVKRYPRRLINRRRALKLLSRSK